MRLYFGLNIFLLSLFAFGGDIDYQFHWLSLPVAKLSINYNGLLYLDDQVKFKLLTQGPLKLYRNYYTSGYVKKYNENNWDYYLSGEDRGQPEEKLISYFSGGLPIIRKFIDDSGVSPIKIDSQLDKGALDPLTVLLRAIKKLSIKKNCSDTYIIFDGKRRYNVALSLIGKENLKQEKRYTYHGSSYHCRLTMFEGNFGAIKKSRKIWPFNGGHKSLDIWFSEDLDFIPVKFQIKAPLGILVGRLLVEEEIK